MKNLIVLKWILPFYIFVFTLPISAQQIENKNSFWFNGGVGSSYFGPTFNWGVSYSYGQNIFSARYLKGDEFVWGSPGGGKSWDDPQLKMKEFGLLYGRSVSQGILDISLSGGLSYIDGIYRGGKISEKMYAKVNISTIGVPLELHVRVKITDFLGIGASCFGNVNPDRSFAGGTFNIYLGRF
ncbi:MAG: hypothetical protein ACM3P0_03645 [Acidobacteriota bacterium]